jgi:hypothetical protein
MAVYTTIDKPEDYFNTVIYSGSGSTGQTITVGFQPDVIWVKARNQTYDHVLFDSNRGFSTSTTGTQISPNLNSAQPSTTGGHVGTVTSTGWTTQYGTAGTSLANVGDGSATYVCWNWKSNGGTTVTNNDGSHTSTVQANPTAGFSIVTYTGTGSGFTLGHGLGAAPEIIFNKGLSDAHAWIVGATADSANLSKVLILNDTDVSTTATANFNAAPTSSVYTIGTAGGVNNNGQNYISYLFRSIQGYSKIGVYYGNGGSDGTFIYTGFKPRFFMLKGTGNVSSWNMYDTKRDPINRASQQIKANASNAEASTGAMDFLSNGIKIRTSDNDFNGSGNPYLYMAFADNPFVTSDKVPTTAK